MSYLIKLTLKYMKRQKLRTFLTFCCITLAAFAINLFSVYVCSYIETGKNIAAYSTGNYETLFNGLIDTQEKADIFVNHSVVEKGYVYGLNYLDSNLDSQDENGEYSKLDVLCDGKKVLSSVRLTQLYCFGDDSITAKMSNYASDSENDENGMPEQEFDRIDKKNMIFQGNAPEKKGEAAVPGKFREMGYNIGDTVELTLNFDKTEIDMDSKEVKALKEYIDKENKDKKETRRTYIQEFGIPEGVDEETYNQAEIINLKTAFSFYGRQVFSGCTGKNYLDYIPFKNEHTVDSQTIKVKITGFTDGDIFKFADFNDGFDVADELNKGDMWSFERQDCTPVALARISKGIDFDEGLEKLYTAVGYNKDDFEAELDTANEGRISLNISLLSLEVRGSAAISQSIMIYGIILIVMILIWLVCRFSVDNAFEISVQERVEQFNTMRILGASRKQIGIIVLFEAFLYCLTAVPIGILLAILICRLTLGYATAGGLETMLVGKAAERGSIFEFSLNPIIMTLSVLLTVVGVIISAYTSSMWAGRKISLNQALNYGKPKKKQKPLKAKKTKLKRVKHFILSYTLKNIGRTKKRFVMSVVAMSVSTVLLAVILLSGGAYYFIFKENIDNSNFCDMSVEFFIPEDMTVEEFIEPYKNSEITDKVSLQLSQMTDISYDIEKNGAFFHQIFDPSEIVYMKKSTENGITKMTQATFIDENFFNTFMKPYVNMTYDEYKSGGKYAITSNMHGIADKKQFYSQSDLGVDEMPEFTVYDKDGKEKMKFSLSGVVCDVPIVAFGNTLLIPIEYMDEISTDSTMNSIVLYFDIADNDKAYDKLMTLLDSGDYMQDSYWICQDLYMINNQLGALVKAVLLYVGSFFVTLWLIGLVNMVDTINTGVLNRRHELAMLKATGTSTKMINRSVYLESMLFSFTSTFIGLILANPLVISLIRSDYKKIPDSSIMFMIAMNIAIIVFNVIVAVLAAKPSLNTIKKKNINNLLSNIE